MKLKQLAYLGLSFLFCSPLFAQLNTNIHYSVETNTSYSSGQDAPFWFSANKNGLSSIKSSSGYLRMELYRPYDTHKKWQLSYGLDVATTYNHTSSFVVQQAYASLYYRPFEITLGSKEYSTSFLNQQLSSGGMTSSSNARPIPQLRIAIPNYVHLFAHNDWFYFKGHLAYGMFTDNNWQTDFTAPGKRYTQNGLYNSKSFFIKVGNLEKFPVSIEAGLEMAAQFGGDAYNVVPRPDDPNPASHYSHIAMGSGIGDFFKALIPLGDDVTDAGYSNVQGNHLGSWQLAINYQLDKWGVRFYYEHFFEDQSMMFLQYDWKDGLMGYEITFPENRFIHQLVYEYMETKDQAGPIYHDSTQELPQQISARDNYYNHGIYTGWQHWGMGIGNPLLLSPIYNTNGDIHFNSTRVIAHHIGITGNPTNDLSYRLLCSYTKSWGTYDNPYTDTKSLVAGLVELTYAPTQLKGWQFATSFGFNAGSQLGHSYGAMLSIKKCGLLSK